MKRVAILGASGFVGSTLFEYLRQKPEYELVPVIHSPGNAWRLARFRADLHIADLLSRKAVTKVLENVDYVVNCTRGDTDIMFDGLKNVIRACRENGVSRFVHLSSVMVFGDPPAAESEDAPEPRLPASSYGGIKQRQDRMVEAAAKKGLPSIILVPPNISGPYSYFLQALTDSVRAGNFALLDGGGTPIYLVDVLNLCHAIELAFDAERADGQRYFITDDDELSWKDVTSSLAELFAEQPSLRSVTRSTLEGSMDGGSSSRFSIVRSLKHLVSSDVREALRKDPLFEKMDLGLRSLVARLGPRIEDWFRMSIEGPIRIRKRAPMENLNIRLSAQQLRDVRPSCARARDEMGYSPPVTGRQSIDAFVNWYRMSHGLETEFGDLLLHLYD